MAIDPENEANCKFSGYEVEKLADLQFFDCPMQENECLFAYISMVICTEAEEITIACLPGTAGERIRDLREEHGWKRYELAEKIGVDASTLGRIESGKTQTISNETVQALASVFGVSTDYLLGIANTPDKKNYDIGELGLSVQAAKNLYTRKVNADVVNRLLEQPRFATLTQMMAQYFDGTLAAGFAAQNQILASVNELLLGQAYESDEDKQAATEAARTINAAKTPPYQADFTSIQNTFATLLKEMKAESQTDFSAQKQMTKEIFDKLVAGLKKGQDGSSLHLPTPEQMVNVITSPIEGMDGLTDEELQGFKSAVLPLFIKLLQEGVNGSSDK